MLSHMDYANFYQDPVQDIDLLMTQPPDGKRRIVKRHSVFSNFARVISQSYEDFVPINQVIEPVKPEHIVKTEYPAEMSWPYLHPKQEQQHQQPSIGLTAAFTEKKTGMVATRTTGNKKRINSWTQQEEAFLIGVVVAKYLSKGSLFSVENVKKKRKRGDNDKTKSKSRSQAIEECWESIKEAFDSAWSVYCSKTGFQRSCDRSGQALSRHYKVMKTKLKRGGQASFHMLYRVWRTEYNVHDCLLHPDFFNFQERLKHQVYKNTPPATLPLNAWTNEEEIFLAGIVVDRFIKRGSLVSSRSSQEDNDCWSTIKRTYDLAWDRYTMQTGIEMPRDRSINALCRHYKNMRSIFEQNINDLLDSGRDSVIARQEGRRNINLSQVYDVWQGSYNVNNVLVRTDEY